MSTKRVYKASGAKKTQMKDWNQIVRQAQALASQFRKRNGFSPTLRGLFYMLVSKNLIPNTRSSYGQLSQKLSRLRYQGMWSWDLIRDTTRKTAYAEATTRYPDKSLTAEELKKVVENYIKRYTNVSLNPWDDQPERVIILIEKEALFETVRKIVTKSFPHGVHAIVAMRGYDSATNVKQLADLVSGIAIQKQKPVILALGDFDPSGEDIPRDAHERIKMLSGVDFSFEKVAVKAEHVVNLNLPIKPETAEEINKMKRDPRYQTYVSKLNSNPLLAPLIKKYGGLVRVELDALVSLKPDEFTKTLTDALWRHFDKGIYEKVTKPREEELKKKAEEYRDETLKELGKLWSRP